MLKNLLWPLSSCMWRVASIVIIIMIIDTHYDVALGQPIDCCVKCTKELVWAKQCWNSDGQAWDASLCVSCTGL